MENIFQASKEYPFHISVGAVLSNKKGEICCHFYKKADIPMRFEAKGDIYLLMRETIEHGETIEESIHRGLLEEFGSTGDIKNFLGSIVSHFPLEGSSMARHRLAIHWWICERV